MLNEDLLHSFPKILRNEISVHIIQSRTHILNTYDEALSKYAEVGHSALSLACYTPSLTSTGPVC
jgi:NADH dehydrogenase